MVMKTYIFLVYMYVFNPFLTNVIKNLLGLPNVLSVFKDLLLLFLFGYVLILKKKFRMTASVCISLTLLLIFSFYYLGTSLNQARISEGVYYFRTHFFPIIFLITSVWVVQGTENVNWNRLFKHLLIINIISLILTVLIYAVALINIRWFMQYMGLNDMLVSLRISHANFLRATAPQAGPNLLGFYYAVNILVLSLYYYLNKNKTFWLFMLIIADAIGMFLTFSRSSLLFLMFAFLTILLLRPSRYLKWFARIGLISGLFLVIIVAVANGITGGKMQAWVEKSVSFRDDSMRSRSSFIGDALKDIDEYIVSGYPKGTVGALSTVKNFHHCENSFFILFMDMGLPQFLILFFSFLVVALSEVRNVSQIALLIGVFANFQVLPNVQAYSLMIYILWVFILLKNIKFVKEFNRDIKYNFSLVPDSAI